MALSDDNVRFISDLAIQGAAYAIQYDLPIAAMVACGCLESGYGTSALYISTKCPFNLQKPTEYRFPLCPTIPVITYKDREKTQKVVVPMCVAKDLNDAARLWCEWIIHYPNVGARRQLLLFRNDARRFASQLPLVGFGVARRTGGRPGDEYAKAFDDVNHLIPFELIEEPEES